MSHREDFIHLAMRTFLRQQGWQLIAGQFPGGSDHELHALQVTDPAVARDRSPDPRRHSSSELIPDLIALRDRNLFIGEAKPRYDHGDLAKLVDLLDERRDHLLTALDTFAHERQAPELLPAGTLELLPVLIFSSDSLAPRPPPGFSYLRIVTRTKAYFEGHLGETQ